MASAGLPDANPDVITFDIFDGNMNNGDTIFTETLTEEEQNEMRSIVQEFKGVNSEELIAFTSQEFALGQPRHKY